MEVTPLYSVIQDVFNGKITCWEELEMKSVLYELDDIPVLIRELLRYPNVERVYDLFRNTMLNGDSMDHYFAEYPLITKMIEVHNTEVYGRNLVIDMDTELFDSLSMLKEMDVRNPKYLLRYFLYDNPIIPRKSENAYYSLFLETMERAKIRGKKMEIFGEYHDRLARRYLDRTNLDMMTS